MHHNVTLSRLPEGMLDYLADARKRLAKPGAAVIPARRETAERPETLNSNT